jgi:hypothetical protein
MLAPEHDLKGFQAEHDGWKKFAFRPRTAQILNTGMEQGAQTVDGKLNADGLFRGKRFRI